MIFFSGFLDLLEDPLKVSIHSELNRSSDFFFFLLNLLFFPSPAYLFPSWGIAWVFNPCAQFQPNSSLMVTVLRGFVLKLASASAEWRVLSLLLMAGAEVGDSEKSMSAVASSMGWGPDFHNVTHLLNKMCFGSIVLKVLTVDIEYCLK